MEQNIPNQENAIVLAGKSIANKKIAEIQEEAEIVEQIEPEDNTEVEEVPKAIEEATSAESSELKKMI